jgi:hypothetical protein
MEFELNELHIDYLKKVKKVRIRSCKIFLSRTALLLFIFFALPFAYIGYDQAQDCTAEIYFFYPFLFIMGAIFLIVGFSFLVLFFQGILPLTEDINYGKGVKKSVQIINKSYFPITNDYYIFLDSKEPENIKVDHISYSHYQIGDYYTLFEAKYSDVVFEDFDRFEIM